ncbi:hypothetical protein ABH937_007081 [Kitasatospora sp. GAS1066B]
MSAPDPAADLESVEAPVLATEPPGEQPSSRSRRLPRATIVTLATLGLLAVTAASATVTVAVGRPGHHPAAAAAIAPAGPSTAPAAQPGPGTSATPVPLPSLSLAPSPTGNLHGSVNGDTHGGDLRFFLVTLPDGAEAYGAADGTALTVSDIAKNYAKPDETQGILDSYGYQEAAYRRYRTADGQTEISAQLMRFSSADNAKAFAQSATWDSATSVSVNGDSSARGFLFKPAQQADTGELAGVGWVGDVEYEVHVYVKGDPDASLLADAMKRQRDRLGSGG